MTSYVLYIQVVALLGVCLTWVWLLHAT